MVCSNTITSNLSTTDYVDCSITTVSGHLQDQIDDIVPGVWEVLGSATATSLDKNSTVSVSSLPARDILRIVVFGENVQAAPFAMLAMNFNDDDTAANYYGTSASSAKGIFLNSVATTSRDLIVEAVISNKSSAAKNCTGTGMARIGTSSTSATTVSHGWSNTASQINRIVLSFDYTSEITSASADELSIIVLGMNF